MTHAPPPRPWRAAAIIGAIAQLLFSFRLTSPHKLMFDEVHYVPAARTLLALSGPANIEHPLLGKEFIAAGIALFGDNSMGWRFFSTLAGTATVLGIFAMAWLIFGRVRTATLAALFALLNITIFIEARIAMLDGFMAAFVVLGLAALLWSMRAPPGKTWAGGPWPRWLLGSVLLGLAVAAKWAAAPIIAYAAIAFIVVRLRDGRRQRQTIWATLNGTHQPHWPGLPVVPALLALGFVSIASYCLTFIPALFYTTLPLPWHQLIAFQARMYAAQTQVLPPHPYQSSWWSWPLMIRPIWYLYEQVDGAQRGVLMIGNPAILWGGLVAVAACLWAGLRNGAVKLLAVALLWVGAYAMWALIPKSIGFFYYYYLPSILLALPLAGAWEHYGKGRLKNWDEGFVALSAGLFAYFYPIISALPLGGPQSFQHWMWFPSWP
ncbi:phospholipid carrier-dependent glycosyltransferase [Sphingomonas sp. AR_OL41]|uniref:phospholipid carrier-dependent glycosyltransferase n=1 Tax=Sphingomonas sp. AR_OL41 TaxID=3042729 RepID=UPI00248155BE|nr:phospholipid carrier-dependent glycosyltransferase [Sphingomonas sp. AR_OL41]MDH7973096.1 phospholipid carrier-dependent glycosyltransferase [Sphingomonas sp. AR_OL41]